MKIFRLLILSAIVVSFSGFNSFSQRTDTDFTDGFRTGDADILSVHFNERLQLTVMAADYRLSKAQATEIMRDFFRKFPPLSYSVLFKGNKKDSNFTVGKLVTQTGSFRVTVFFGKIDNKNLIHLLEIEKEDESKF